MARVKADFWSLALILALVLGASQAASWWLGRGQGEELRALAKPGDIVMLSSQTCIYCDKARAWMTAQQVPFRECFIESDAACLAEFQARGARGTPTLVVRGQTQLGFDQARLIQSLKP